MTAFSRIVVPGAHLSQHSPARHHTQDAFCPANPVPPKTSVNRPQQLLELAGSTLLLLDEPTDNLDLSSAEALQEGMESYQGTVLAVTHDRWFARSFDRFLVFRADGNVQEYDSPVWDETRPVRPR